MRHRILFAVFGVDFEKMDPLTEGKDALLFSEEEEDESANDVLVNGLDIVDKEFVFTRALGQSFAEIEQCVVDRGSIWEFKVEMGCVTSVAKPSSLIELSDVQIDGFTKLPNPLVMAKGDGREVGFQDGGYFSRFLKRD